MSPPSSSGKPPAVVSEMTRTRTQLEYERQEKYRQQQQQQMTHSSFINNPLLRANNNQSTTPQTLTTTNSASLFSHAPYDSTYEKVTSIRKQIEDIQKASSVIEELYTEDAMAGKAGPSRENSERIDRGNTKINEMIARARLSIKSIECSETSISIKHQQSNLARQLMAAIQDFQKIHFRAKQMYRDNIKRQYKIAQPFATEAEIERIMEDHQAAAAGNNNNNITSLMSSGFQQDFNTNPNLEEQRKALQGVESRLHELESIEKAICQLFDIMQDMQLMLGNQQAAFDSIEIMVDTTADQVHDGSNQLTKATVSAKGARKKKWILLIIVILLLIIAIILVYFYVILPMTTAKKITEKAAN